MAAGVLRDSSWQERCSGTALVAAEVLRDSLCGSRGAQGQPLWQQRCLGTALVAAEVLRDRLCGSRGAQGLVL